MISLVLCLQLVILAPQYFIFSRQKSLVMLTLPASLLAWPFSLARILAADESFRRRSKGACGS